MNSLNWYISLYYKFRQYPIPEINASYKSNQLRPLYTGMLKKQFALFQLDNKRDGEIEGIISKNNYDHMLNKKAESNLEQEEALLSQQPPPPEDNALLSSRVILSRASLSSGDRSHLPRDSEVSVMSQQSRWLVQGGPNEKNMDVFYELMIKMIRISLRRLTIETFAFDRYARTLGKEGIREAIKNNAEYSQLYNRMYAETGRESEADDPAAIEELSFPTTTEQLKYEFLKYCISCKVYNNPVPKQQSSSSSLVSQSSNNSNTSQQSVSQQSNKVEQLRPVLPGQNEIQSLILRVSESETCIFNHLIDLYMEEIRKSGNNQIEILGVKNIAQSVFEMSSGKPLFNTATNSLGINRNRFRRGIFDERGEYARQSDALSNSNLLLATWLDLILFKEQPAALHEIIERLVSLGDRNSYLASVGPADRLGHNQKFYLKISSYLHLLILNSTKNLFAQSLCKVNYLLVLAQDVLGDSPQQLKRSFKDVRLRRFECRVGGEMKSFDDVKLTYDAASRRNLWKQEAIEVLLAKWKIIANTITEVCVRNSKAFFAAIFQRCVQLLDQQLSLQLQLANQLMDISEGITLEGEIKQREGEKCDSIRRGLNQIIREIIGMGGNGGEEGVEQRFLGINSFANFRSQRYRESSFVNRQQSAQQLSKWCEIISQNIYIFKQYCECLSQVSSLFRNHHIYIALWFNKFHSETKTLIPKMNRSHLQSIFSKFLKEIPVLWESMNSEKDLKRTRNRKRVEKSKFRNRISSIKTDSPLSISQKKAIVLNYVLKAELELYSHYMHIDLLNGQHKFSDLFQRQITRKEQSSRPQLFSHPLIKALLLFPGEQESERVQSEGRDEFRREARHFTSNFAVPKSFIEIENTKTMSNIQKSEVNAEVQQLMRMMSHFEKPMNIQLDLKDNWKERFGDTQVSFLAELSDYLRYLNEVNYLYQLWSWTDQSRKDEGRRNRVDLLNGAEYYADLETLDAYFRQLKGNAQFLSELQLMHGQTEKLVADEQLSEMLKRIKIHNKQLYMINEAIIEAQNYFKLLGANLIGRSRDDVFRALLQQAINNYKTTKREKPSLRMLDKSQDNMMESLKLQPKRSQIRFNQTSEGKESSMGRPIKRGPLVSHFEFTPEYYKIQSKIVRVNCLIASFEVENAIYQNIKSYRVLSRERLERLAIIGGRYYDRLQELIGAEQGELLISEELLVRTKNIYEKKLLLLMTTLINLNYQSQGRANRHGRKATRRQFSNIPQQHLKSYGQVLRKYAQILRRFIYCKIRQNIKRMEQRERFEQANNNNEHERKEDREFSICRFIEEILELTEKKEEFGEQALLVSLQAAIEKESNIKFCQQFKRQLQSETDSLNVYKSQQEKVEYLRKKLSYLLMREMYFTLNYDNDFLQEKSVNSKRNYSIYQQRISSFYEEIIQLDYEDYMQRKEEELKKRSVHLKNYQFKYERQPPVSHLEKHINQLICCLFNQLLNTYTSSAEYKMFTRRHKPTAQNGPPHQLFNQYCASEYSRKASKEETVTKPSHRKTDRKHKKQKDSITSIFAQMFQMKTDSTPIAEETPNEKEEEAKVTVLIYTEQKFQLSQSIKVYLNILNDYEYSAGGGSRRTRQVFQSSQNSLSQEPITQMQLQIIRINERSLITMLKSDFLQKINEAKCTLIRKNLIANIQKLYINLDVRHKVFQSFKDRILNYEMQKTKIYHQYMDYIRGLKLDVYSHMAGEDPLPYIKIIHAVKLYRLQVKKMELEQRVNQQFEKNLQKWNIGIQKNMAAYDLWLKEEEEHWLKQQQQYLSHKKSLFQIFHAVSKQMVRQNRNEKRKQSSVKSSSRQPSNVQSFAQQSKPPLTVSAKNVKFLCKKSILKQKQLFEEGKKNEHFKSTSSAVNLHKFPAFSESTKPQTKYQKPQMIRNMSQGGLRGLSMKFDPSNYLMQQDKAKKVQFQGRKTEANDYMKISDVFKKKQKRYQSAQKYRPINQQL